MTIPLRAILIKELRQLRANPFLPKLILMFPLMVMLVMPLVTSMEVRQVPVVVVDQDHSTISRRIISDINANEYTTLQAVVATRDQAMAMMERDQADVIVEIPRGLGKSIETSHPLTISVSANAVNATQASLGSQYVTQIIAPHVNHPYGPRCHAVPPHGASLPSVTYLFNPTLDYRHFMIPALMIMLLVMLCGFLPALNIVGEKERGTIEQINVSPASQLTFTLGKVIPYWAIGILVLTIAMVIAGLVWNLWPQGSWATIYIASALMIILMSSMAVVIANFSDTMQQAMLVMFFFVMVFILMSGLMTPVESMPDWARRVTYGIPPRYYVDIMRATYLRGATLANQLPQFLALASFAIAFTLAAIVTYRKRT
ncbi:MAG: ABC transporter permease [Bacteroidales bacterium]|nr:ABC transporter permease [Bacteroidales bacterium]MCD8395284.1 ABC transporter permease [Bacteroidales bacterium]